MKTNICYPGKDLWAFDLDVDGPEDVFAQFNHGSGRECDQFLSARMRSMMVGDFVQLDGQWFECLAYGWDPVDANRVIDECCIRAN